MRRLLHGVPEPLRFAIVGAVGFVVDAAVLTAILALAPSAVLAARVPSFLVAATATWWLHRVYTFRATGAHGGRWRQWLAFIATNGAGNALNVLVYGVLATLAGWRPLVALATASVVAATVNYLTSRHLVFRRRSGAQVAADPTQPEGIEASASWRSHLRRWLAPLAVLAAYLALATHLVLLPGLYLDAVNPDYLVLKLIVRDHASPLVAWVLPGNYLAGGRVPVLISLYHGMQQFWLGLPLYALLGTSVWAIRIVHAVFACGVLLALWALLRAAGLDRRPVAWLAALALAVDPAFLYAFRTQSYITLAPAAWLLLSLALLARPGTFAPARLRWSGFFFGLAVLGYFVYAFFAPAMLFALRAFARARAGADPRLQGARMPAWWLLGAFIGSAYYLLGYALLARAEGGFGGFVRYLLRYQADQQAFASSLGLLERIAASWTLLGQALDNAWQHAMIFGSLESLPLPGLRLAVLLGVPAAVFVGFRLRGERMPLLATLVALQLSFFVVSLVFGARLGGHHFIVLLPVAYAALAIAAARLADASFLREPGRELRMLTLAALAVLLAVNGAGQAREFALLRQTGGTGLLSDAIHRFGDDLARRPAKPLVAFPDWGLVLQIEMLTDGKVPTIDRVDIPLLRRMLCAGGDIMIAAIQGDRGQRIAGWTRALGWSAPLVTPYRQRDGAVVFEVALFSADNRVGRCGTPEEPGTVSSAVRPVR